MSVVVLSILSSLDLLGYLSTSSTSSTTTRLSQSATVISRSCQSHRRAQPYRLLGSNWHNFTARRETTQYLCGQTQPPLANKPDLAADKSPAKAIVFLKTCPASVSSKGIWHHISFVQIGGWAKFNYTDACISLGCHANCQRWLANEPRPDLLRLSHSEGIMGHPVMSFAMTYPPCFSTPHILPSSGHRRKAFEKHLQAR